jgi:hypothetical protein
MQKKPRSQLQADMCGFDRFAVNPVRPHPPTPKISNGRALSDLFRQFIALLSSHVKGN